MELNIDSFEYVSFDIFDTLVKRCVTNPHDVFDLIDRYCKKMKFRCLMILKIKESRQNEWSIRKIKDQVQ